MKFKMLLALGLAVILASTASLAADTPLKTPQQRISYGLGHDLGLRITQQYQDVVPEALYKGMQDAFNKVESKVPQEELIRELGMWRQTQALKAKAIGDKYLAENKKRKSITTTASGLQYEVITKGKGKKPLAGDSVIVNYSGKLIDGTEFDSSYKRGTPATFPVSGVIPGMSEALQLMQEGAKWKIYIPSDIGYGERGAGGAIGPNETLVFDLELIGIKPAE